MRARRLRRLGVATALQSQAPHSESQPIESPLAKADVSLDGQKNKISSSTHGSIEIDENEHKQKHLKFDEDFDVEKHKKESMLNNNDEVICE